MGKSKILFGAVLVAMLLVVGSASEAAGFRQLIITDGTHFNGTEIPKGEYKLRWIANGSATSVTLKLYKGNKVVAEAEGKVVRREEKAASDGLLYRPNGDGSRSIAEVRFANKRKVIVIQG